jgi:hypothetical protein
MVKVLFFRTEPLQSRFVDLSSLLVDLPFLNFFFLGGFNFVFGLRLSDRSGRGSVGG